VADLLRRSGKPLVFAANKADSPARESGIYDFAPLGLGLPLPISATQGRGIPELLDAVVEGLRRLGLPPDGRAGEEPLRLAFVGRPNVGKSSLVNALLGRERLLVSDRPGTTRDAVDVLWRQGGREFLLVDTPGMRRRSRVREPLEQASLRRARLAVRRAEVVCLVLEAPEPVTHHEKSIAGFIAEAGRSCLLLVNKWDLVPAEERAGARRLKEAELRRELPFLDWAPVEFVSALTGEGLGRLPDLFCSLGKERKKRVGEEELGRVLAEAWKVRPPRAVGREFQKLFRAFQAGAAPPTFVLEVSHPRSLPEDYLRYLEGRIRAAFGFRGTPIRFLVRGFGRRAGRAR
jgi:GTP-binding protein